MTLHRRLGPVSRPQLAGDAFGPGVDLRPVPEVTVTASQSSEDQPSGKRELGPFDDSREDMVVAGVDGVSEAGDLLRDRVL